MIRAGLRIKHAKFICCFMLIFMGFVFPLSVQAAEEGNATSPVSVKVYSEMSDNSSVTANLIAGNTFQVIEKASDDEGAVWYRIRTDFGTEGYVSAGEIERLDAEKQILRQEPSKTIENEETDDADKNDLEENESDESALEKEISEKETSENEASDKNVSEEASDSQKEDETDGEVIALANLNLRSMPSARSNIVSKVKKGIRLKCYQKIVNDSGESWYEVEYDGMEGYVIAKAVRLVKVQHSEEETESGAEHTTDYVDSEENTEMEVLPEEISQTDVPVQLEQQSEPQSANSAQFAFEVDEEPDVQKERKKRSIDWMLIILITGEILCVAIIVVFIMKIRKLHRNR